MSCSNPGDEWLETLEQDAMASVQVPNGDLEWDNRLAGSTGGPFGAKPSTSTISRSFVVPPAEVSATTALLVTEAENAGWELEDTSTSTFDRFVGDRRANDVRVTLTITARPEGRVTIFLTGAG